MLLLEKFWLCQSCLQKLVIVNVGCAFNKDMFMLTKFLWMNAVVHVSNSFHGGGGVFAGFFVPPFVFDELKVTD